MCRDALIAHPSTQEIVRGLVACYEKMGRPAQGEPLLRELADFWKQIGVAGRERGRGHGRVENRSISVVSLHPCPDLGGEFFPHAAQAIKVALRS